MESRAIRTVYRSLSPACQAGPCLHLVPATSEGYFPASQAGWRVRRAAEGRIFSLASKGAQVVKAERDRAARKFVRQPTQFVGVLRSIDGPELDNGPQCAGHAREGFAARCGTHVAHRPPLPYESGSQL